MKIIATVNIRGTVYTIQEDYCDAAHKIKRAIAELEDRKAVLSDEKSVEIDH